MCWLGPGQEKFCNVLTEQLLLRGAMLRKSEWAVGVVVYTGMQTKLKMNDEETPAKTTQVSERFSLIALQYGLSAPELQWQCRGEWRISPGVNGKRLGQHNLFQYLDYPGEECAFTRLSLCLSVWSS